MSRPPGYNVFPRIKTEMEFILFLMLFSNFSILGNVHGVSNYLHQLWRLYINVLRGCQGYPYSQLPWQYVLLFLCDQWFNASVWEEFNSTKKIVSTNVEFWYFVIVIPVILWTLNNFVWIFWSCPRSFICLRQECNVWWVRFGPESETCLSQYHRDSWYRKQCLQPVIVLICGGPHYWCLHHSKLLPYLTTSQVSHTT